MDLSVLISLETNVFNVYNLNLQATRETEPIFTMGSPVAHMRSEARYSIMFRSLQDITRDITDAINKQGRIVLIDVNKPFVRLEVSRIFNFNETGTIEGLSYGYVINSLNTICKIDNLDLYTKETIT